MSFKKRKLVVEEGDVVILYLGINRISWLDIVPTKTSKKNNEVENIVQTPYGTLKPFSLIGKQYGSKISLSKGWGHILRPTPELWTHVVPHRTQILYGPDISMILLRLNTKPGSVVIEAGTGSGSLSHAFVNAIKPFGHLYTFDFHEVRATIAREEFKKHGLTDWVTVEHRDVGADGFGRKLYRKADAVFLDLPNPWNCIKHALKCLKKCSIICTFSPCIEQVQRTVEQLNTFHFENIFTLEIIQTQKSVHRRINAKMSLNNLKFQRARWCENSNERPRITRVKPRAGQSGHRYTTNCVLQTQRTEVSIDPELSAGPRRVGDPHLAQAAKIVKAANAAKAAEAAQAALYAKSLQAIQYANAMKIAKAAQIDRAIQAAKAVQLSQAQEAARLNRTEHTSNSLRELTSLVINTPFNTAASALDYDFNKMSKAVQTQFPQPISSGRRTQINYSIQVHSSPVPYYLPLSSRRKTMEGATQTSLCINSVSTQAQNQPVKIKRVTPKSTRQMLPSRDIVTHREAFLLPLDYKFQIPENRPDPKTVTVQSLSTKKGISEAELKAIKEYCAANNSKPSIITHCHRKSNKNQRVKSRESQRQVPTIIRPLILTQSLPFIQPLPEPQSLPLSQSCSQSRPRRSRSDGSDFCVRKRFKNKKVITGSDEFLPNIIPEISPPLPVYVQILQKISPECPNVLQFENEVNMLQSSPRTITSSPSTQTGHSGYLSFGTAGRDTLTEATKLLCREFEAPNQTLPDNIFDEGESFAEFVERTANSQEKE